MILTYKASISNEVYTGEFCESIIKNYFQKIGSDLHEELKTTYGEHIPSNLNFTVEITYNLEEV